MRKPPLEIYTLSPHTSTPKYSQGRSSNFCLHQVSIFVVRTILSLKLLCETNSFPFVFGHELVNQSPLHVDAQTQFTTKMHLINGDKQGYWQNGRQVSNEFYALLFIISQLIFLLTLTVDLMIQMLEKATMFHLPPRRCQCARESIQEVLTGELNQLQKEMSLPLLIPKQLCSGWNFRFRWYCLNPGIQTEGC